jgi:hypothetical protein
MALIKKEVELKLTQQEWTRYKKLCSKGGCKSMKDPSEVFRIGLQNACYMNKVL